MTTTKTAAAPKTAAVAKDAIALLKADHEAASHLFAEQEGVKGLIARLEGVQPDGELYDAKVKVLSKYVKHHVKEEQREMFPKAKASSLDMAKLGARMAARQDDLLVQQA